MTSFGPFYGGSDADIDLLIDSVGKIAELDADTYVTGHEAGVLSRKDFFLQAESFLEIIGSRAQKILSVLSTPLTLKEKGRRSRPGAHRQQQLILYRRFRFQR